MQYGLFIWQKKTAQNGTFCGVNDYECHDAGQSVIHRPAIIPRHAELVSASHIKTA
jgi:hypothetical protein